MYQFVVDYLKQNFQLSEAFYEHLLTKLHRHEFSRKHFLLSKDQVVDRIWLVETGFVRAYYLNKGNEITAWFMQEGDFVISVESFFEQKPSIEFIHLLEDSVLISITHHDLQELYRLFPEFNLVGRMIVQRYYVQSEKRLVDMRNQTSKARYLALLKRWPALFNRATVKDIASYIGMKPETLSRLRGQKL
jgi:CRP-like cAMP-binding protein